jgi:diketogulonate reductase-like aldo/keto reductase
MQVGLSRRDFGALVTGGAALIAGAHRLAAQASMPTRVIPGTGETLPIVGLGSTRPVMSIRQLGADRVEAIVRALTAHGGRVVDTWPRDSADDSIFGRILRAPTWRDDLFVTINIEQTDPQAGVEHFRRVLSDYGRESIDLVNVGSLIGLDAQWPNLRSFRERGQARYIGVTAAQPTRYDRLEAFLRDEAPDFVMLNYSVTEREAEKRLLPMLADRGIAVLISRPFMNGAYFERLEKEPLPDFAAAFECESWSQFSLQYILANPNVSCVLTETTNPLHMAENALTAFKPFPDAAARQRMRAHIDQL